MNKVPIPKVTRPIPQIRFYCPKRMSVVQIVSNQGFITFYINIMTVIQLTEINPTGIKGLPILIYCFLNIYIYFNPITKFENHIFILSHHHSEPSFKTTLYKKSTFFLYVSFSLNLISPKSLLRTSLAHTESFR